MYLSFCNNFIILYHHHRDLFKIIIAFFFNFFFIKLGGGWGFFPSISRDTKFRAFDVGIGSILTLLLLQNGQLWLFTCDGRGP
jgi:hypothetical protein